MIPRQFIQELLARTDIVELIGRHVPLRREGSNHVACCPFHNEKSPSFKVSAPKQIYKCFGCGASGNALGFLMEYQGIDFVEAVRQLAAGAGLPVPDERPALGERGAGRGDGPDLHEILREATRYYREQLRHSPRAIDYLKCRGLSGETAARFGIGYAPPGWQNLAQAFPDYGSAALEAVGLVVAGEGRRYDFFRDRIMFPILNQKGLVCGFGGRVLDPEQQPKYLNSRESALFDKGRELYNLFAARRAIRQAGRVLVVEGYMDVVGLAQHSVDYAVATLGTATTPDHVQKLVRQSDEVVFCFDGDAAGRRAAWRALENSLAQLADGRNLSFLFLPQGDDPDSYVAREGKAAFEALIDAALPLSEYLVRALAERHGLDSEEGRAGFLRDAGPLLARVPAPALSLLLRQKVARVAGIGADQAARIWGFAEAKRDGTDTRVSPVSPRGPARPLRRPPSRWRELLGCVATYPGVAALWTTPLPTGEEDGSEPALRALAEVLAWLRSAPGTPSTARVLQHFAGSGFEREIEHAVDQVDGTGAGEAEQVIRDFQRKRAAELRKRQRVRITASGRTPNELSEEEKAVLRGDGT